MISYKILSRGSAAELEDLVAEWIEDGYVPHGGMCACLDANKEYDFFQAMIKTTP